MSVVPMPPTEASSGGKRNWKKILAIVGGVATGAALVTIAIVLGVKSHDRNGQSGKPTDSKPKGKKATGTKARSGGKYDLILSSGFLAFADHTSFLQAVEEAGLKVGGVMGTSAGALTGSLYCAGYSPKEVAEFFSDDPPSAALRLGGLGGLLSVDGLVEKLREKLPARFEDLKKEFAVSVVDRHGKHHIIDSGPLPEAVAASAAVPFLFKGVDIPGRGDQNPCKDGGIVDRIGVDAWRSRRRAQQTSRGKKADNVLPALVHVVKRSSPFSGFGVTDTPKERNLAIFHSPNHGVNLLSLGDAQTNSDAARVKDILQPAQHASGHNTH